MSDEINRPEIDPALPSTVRETSAILEGGTRRKPKKSATSPCGRRFAQSNNVRRHVRSCLRCQALERGERKRTTKMMNQQGTHGDEEEQAMRQEEREEEEKHRSRKHRAGDGSSAADGSAAGDGSLSEYVLPEVGPDRLREILRNHRYSAAESERICRSFAAQRWAWENSGMLFYFLSQFQLPPHTASAIVTEYFGTPGFGMPGMPGMGPGMMPGMNPFMSGMMPGMMGMSPGMMPGMNPWMNPFFPPMGGGAFPNSPYSYPPPAQAPAPAPASDGTARAAIESLGNIVNTVMERSPRSDGQNETISNVLNEMSERMKDRIEMLQAVHEQKEEFLKYMGEIKAEQLREVREQQASIVNEVNELRRRNPATEFQAWKNVIESGAKELGFVPQGSQDIYGALTAGFKEVNDTMRTGIGAAFNRSPKDRSMEERRSKAEAALQEETLVQRAMEAVRRAERQMQRNGGAEEHQPASAHARPTPEEHMSQSMPQDTEAEAGEETEESFRSPAEFTRVAGGNRIDSGQRPSGTSGRKKHKPSRKGG